MSFRLGRIITCMVIIFAAYGLYMVKWEVRELKLANAKLVQHISEEKRSLNVLDAEWAYVNRPERLRRMVEEHLQMNTLQGQQFADIGTVGLPTEPQEGTMKPGTLLSSFKKY